MSDDKKKNRLMYLRPYHPSYIMIYYSKRDKNWGESSEKKWRWLINRLENEPDLKVRIVESYDDGCAGCHMLRKSDHTSVWGYGYICPTAENPALVKEVTEGNKFFYEKMGLFFGDEILMRDMVKLLAEKMPVLGKKVYGSSAQRDYAKGLVDYQAKYGLK